MAVVRLKKGRLKTLHPRNPLVYAESIGKIKGSHSPGDIVEVQDYTGDFLGQGTINTNSDKAIRILSWKRSEKIDGAFFQDRIEKAYLMRRTLGVDQVTDAYRVVNSEGDGLPGLVVDRYADCVVVSVETAGIHRFTEEIVAAVEDLFSPRAVVGRPDLASMEVEGFQAKEGMLSGELPDTAVEVRENGLKFFVDLVDGQGTGFYVNQRQNRMDIAALCKEKRILDCFTYTGAFAIYAGVLGGAEKVYGIESSAQAMDLAGRNLEANGAKNVVILQGEVFWELQNLVNRQEIFDVVVVDPPRLITSWKTIEKGIQTYKVLNTLLYMIVREGGLLVTCSSSEILEEEVFENILSECAMESGRQVRILARRGPGVDLPKNPACPRTHALKCYFLHIT